AAGGQADTYVGEIPGDAVVPPSMEFYVTATDGSTNANMTIRPEGAPDTPAVFTVNAVIPSDTEGPTIEHTPFGGSLEAGKAIVFSARVTDPSGVAEVKLWYQVEGAGWEFLILSAAADGQTYSAEVPGNLVVAGDLRYYFEARDLSFAGNVSFEPAQGRDGPLTVVIVGSTAPDGGGGGGCATVPSAGGLPFALLLLAFMAGIVGFRRFGS
ncbi:MAG: hypothetical protein GXP54_05915, partial [Deltaproteobacteria bacterium]|nr:hypothetical protein [Deltaproteobacteria bacterium]